MTMLIPFDGFPAQSLRFLNDLQMHNERDWFNQNKQLYRDYVEQPAKAYAEELAQTLSSITRKPMSFKLFRIYRDVRFSKDKTPYNTHIHISFFCADDTTKSCSAKPAFHFGLETDRIFCGCGYFTFSPELLLDYREVVSHNESGEALQTLVDSLTRSGFSLHEPELKRTPAGFDKDHPRADLLKRKGLVLWHEEPLSEIVQKPALISHVMQHYESMRPLYQWLARLGEDHAV